MYLILNNNNEIKGVGVTTNPNYHSEYVDENNEMYPFKDKSVAYMCCYRVGIVDGMIVSLTPYVDSRLIEHFANLGDDTEVNADNISDNSDGIYDLAEIVSDDSVSIYELADIISELDERVTALEEK